MALALCASTVFTLRSQSGGNLLVAVARRDQPQDLGFALAQRADRLARPLAVTAEECRR